MDLQRWENFRAGVKNEMKEHVITRSSGKFCSQINHIFNAVNIEWINISSIVFNTAFDLYNSSLTEHLDFDIKNTYESLVTSKFTFGNNSYRKDLDFKPGYSIYLERLYDLLNQDNFILLLKELVNDTDFHPNINDMWRSEWKEIITNDLNIEKLIQTIKNKIKLQSSNHKNSEYNSDNNTWFPITVLNNRVYDIAENDMVDWKVIRNLKTNKASILMISNDWNKSLTHLNEDYDNYILNIL